MNLYVFCRCTSSAGIRQQRIYLLENKDSLQNAMKPFSLPGLYYRKRCETFNEQKILFFGEDT